MNYRQPGEGNGGAVVSPALLTDAADDEVNHNRWIDGQGVAAPARAKYAKITPVDGERSLESRKVADSRHHAHADHLHGHGDPLRNAVDGEVTFDIIGFLSRGSTLVL